MILQPYILDRKKKSKESQGIILDLQAEIKTINIEIKRLKDKQQEDSKFI